MSEKSDECSVREGRMENNGISVMKDMTEEDLDKLRYFENNGVLIVPRKVLAKLSGKIFENNGIIVPYEEGVRLYAGTTKMDAATLEAFDEPVEFLQAGRMSFADDVTAELVKAKIKGIKNFGKIIVPEQSYGMVMSRCTENFGKVSKKGEETATRHHHNHEHDDDDDDDDDN